MTMLLRTLLQRLSPWAKSRPKARAHHRRRTYHLAVESLEHRLTPAALFYVGDATIVEGDAGTLNALVPITLMGQHGNKVTVDYRTVAGTAGAGSDYSSVAGTLTFNKNQTSTTIAIPIVGDRLAEANENFTLQLSKA